MNVKKTLGYAGLALLGTFAASASIASVPAFAADWSLKNMTSKTDSMTGIDPITVSNGNIQSTLWNVSTFLLGIAIVLFVAKVVLTAVDRMVFAKDLSKTRADNNFDLTKIPVVGAYDMNLAWKDVFINFGKQVAVAGGVYVLINIIVGVINFIFEKLF